MRNLDTATGPRLVHAMVQLARSLGLVTVAEGVEDLGQAADLTNLGVDLAQGYLLGRPVPAERLMEQLPRVREKAVRSGEPVMQRRD